MRVRTAKGEVIDMSALSSRNSNTVALGNAGMNARGDIVDRSGHIVKSREVAVQEYYNSNPKAVSNNVSLRDLSDEVSLTPAEVIERVDGPKKKAAVAKRKLIDMDD